MLILAIALALAANDPVTLIGTVRVVGPAQDRGVQVEGDGKTMTVTGELAEEVAQLQSLKVEVVGFPTKDMLDVREYRIIDVGGSRGAKSLAILRRHGHLEALVVDRPQVIAEARRFLARHPVAGAERLDFVAGDLLSGVPPARGDKDVYLLSAVLHGFDDTDATRALRQLARACASTGARIAVLELVLPERNVDLAAASFDMQMFMGSRGRERTDGEWQALFANSGLVREEWVRLRSFAGIQVLRPR